MPLKCGPLHRLTSALRHHFVKLVTQSARCKPSPSYTKSCLRNPAGNFGVAAEPQLEFDGYRCAHPSSHVLNQRDARAPQSGETCLRRVSRAAGHVRWLGSGRERCHPAEACAAVL